MIDLQVNGYLGCDFSAQDLKKEDFINTCNIYLKEGADQFLPTIITADLDTYKKNISLMVDSIENNFTEKQIPGLHLEGPFLSPKPGAIGAHQPDCVINPDSETLKKLQDWAKGKIKLLTIAADQPDADELCKTARQLNIKISLGHHLANYDDLEKCYQAGAQYLTHLGNGMPNMVSRHDNPLIAGLCHKDLIPMLIADGFHLPEFLLKGIITLKGIDNVIIVSDASSMAGMPPGKYFSMGNNIVLEDSGLLHNPEKACLVGSSFSLKKCTDYLSNNLGYSKEDILAMVQTNTLSVIKS